MAPAELAQRPIAELSELQGSGWISDFCSKIQASKSFSWTPTCRSPKVSVSMPESSSKPWLLSGMQCLNSLQLKLGLWIGSNWSSFCSLIPEICTSRPLQLMLYLSLQHQTLLNTGCIAGVRLYLWKRSTGHYQFLSCPQKLASEQENSNIQGHYVDNRSLQLRCTIRCSSKMRRMWVDFCNKRFSMNHGQSYVQ